MTVSDSVGSKANIVSCSRSVLRPGAYLVLPVESRIWTPLPNLRDGDAQVLATPQLGAKFVQHELLLRPGGGTIKPVDDHLEQFLFMLEGEAELETMDNRHVLATEGYAWIPPGQAFRLLNSTEASCRLIWVRRQYEPVDEQPVSDAIIANAKDVPAKAGNVCDVQYLLPYANAAFDMACNIQCFEPGAFFRITETHVMEHGLYMLQGAGIYWLNGDYHEVNAGDFIYMAPYCPQYFSVTGKQKARYLLFKDWYRDYIAGL
jgi:(S)-ureidoglycine aminohydrolase